MKFQLIEPIETTNKTPWYAYSDAGEQVRDACDNFVHSNEPNILALIYWLERFGLNNDEIVTVLKEEL